MITTATTARNIRLIVETIARNFDGEGKQQHSLNIYLIPLPLFLKQHP